MIGVMVAAQRRHVHDLKECLAELHGFEIGGVVVLTDRADPVRENDLYDLSPTPLFHSPVVQFRPEGLNLASWYNHGARALGNLVPEIRHVLWVETDVRISYESVLRLREVLNKLALGMVGPDFYGSLQRGISPVRRKPGPVPVPERIGQCFMVRNPAPLMDEAFSWAVEGVDLEWRMREVSGTALVRVPRATHPPDGTTWAEMAPPLPDLVQQSLRRFREKWGMEPW